MFEFLRMCLLDRNLHNSKVRLQHLLHLSYPSGNKCYNCSKRSIYCTVTLAIRSHFGHFFLKYILFPLGCILALPLWLFRNFIYEDLPNWSKACILAETNSTLAHITESKMCQLLLKSCIIICFSLISPLSPLCD